MLLLKEIGNKIIKYDKLDFLDIAISIIGIFFGASSLLYLFLNTDKLNRFINNNNYLNNIFYLLIYAKKNAYTTKHIIMILYNNNNKSSS